MKRIPKRKRITYKNHREMFPAQNFDKKAGTSISKKWNMPEGYDEHRLGWELRRGQLSVKSLAAQLEDINPDINALMQKNPHNIVWGMISRFNLEDMMFFVDKWMADELWASDKSEPHRERIKEVEKKYGVQMWWVPSPATLKKLNNDQNDKPSVAREAQ